MLRPIGVILVLLWLLSFVGHVGGWFMQLMLAVATTVYIVHLLMLDPENSLA